jgi:phospholipid/cholesterol/gamma-HCH transport system permease protein
VILGRTVAALLDDTLKLITFIGETLVTAWWMVRHPRRMRWGDMLSTAQKAGADAVGVVCLLGFLVGLILAFQTAKPLEAYGVQPMIPTIVAIAVVREMGALITAIILAGRSGSAFAAEIGTMKVTEELAALKTMGLEPVQFLVMPRVLAAVLVAPLLTLCNIAMSIVGAYVVMASLGYSLPFYVNQVTHAVDLSDFLGGVFKAFVFGLIIGGVGCLRGTQTMQGPGAVGDSTTRAVVAGIVLTIAADAILGVVYFSLGI